MTEVKPNKDIEYVEPKVTVTTYPLRGVRKPGQKSNTFTGEDFEDALDRVMRPTGRGKFAHMRTSSDEFARRKQEEIELEERSR